MLEWQPHDGGLTTSRALDNGNLQVTFKQALKSDKR